MSLAYTVYNILLFSYCTITSSHDISNLGIFCLGRCHS